MDTRRILFADIPIPAPEKRYQYHELDPGRFEVMEILSTNMPFHWFLNWASRPANMACFIEERDHNRTPKKRNIVQSLRIIMNMIYPSQSLTETGSDLNQVEWLLMELVTPANFIQIYRSLSYFLDGIFEDTVIDGAVVQNVFSKNKSFTKWKQCVTKKPWFTKVMEDQLAGVYRMSEQQKKDSNIKGNRALETKLINVKYVDHTDFEALLLKIFERLEAVITRLREIEDLEEDEQQEMKKEVDSLMKDYIVFASILLQVMSQSRLIEILRVSHFELIPEQSGYIRVTGVAKEPRKKQWEEGTAPMVIEKPLACMKETFLNGEDFIHVIAVIRVMITKLGLDHLPNDPLSSIFVGRMDTVLAHLWPGFKDVDGISHIFRKMGASMSFQTFCPETRTQNSYYMFILGHKHLKTSMNYQSIQISNVSILSQRRTIRDEQHDIMWAERARKRRRGNDDDDSPDDSPDEESDPPDDDPIPDIDPSPSFDNNDDEMVQPSVPEDEDDLISLPPGFNLDVDLSSDDEPARVPVVRAPVPIRAPAVVAPVVADDVRVPVVVAPAMIINLPNRHTGGTINSPFHDYGRVPRNGTPEEKIEYMRALFEELDYHWRDVDIGRMKQGDFKRMGVSQKVWDEFKKRYR